MAKIIGTYKLEKNENLDAFYTAAGVPWIARKMMLVSSPTIDVTQEKNENEEDVWLIKTVSFIRTINLSFKLDEPFEDVLPSGDVFETVARMEGDNKFILDSTREDTSFIREYDFSEDGLVMTMKHPTGVEAKRYFKRVTA
ncbi:fatty acid-binding protein [Folsomia candida]|uniref:Fatty acid-binding protein n=1 Tax=Folsomia candida TaxID=158441 RepID=A0A226DEB1_FOLCA|nr:fatty acid-binding protein [Folsomia candida]OXA43912.1 Fatty acid-binding protein [Folsomia candida]